MGLSNRVSNLKKSLSDSKTRAVVVIVAVIVVVTLAIAAIKFRNFSNSSVTTSSIAAGVPAIESIPGVGQPTREYTKLQEQENFILAQEAMIKGTAAMPTVVRTTYLDTGVSGDFVGATSAEGCGVEELKRAREAGVKAEELRCRGCSLAALKAAGFTASELKAAGFSAAELMQAGFSVDDLRKAGLGAKELLAAGFSAKDLVAAGFTAGELKDAGLSLKDLIEAGVDLKKLAEAGFTAEEFKAHGVSAKELAAAGFSAADLLKAGFSASEIAGAGFSESDLKKAQANLKNAGVVCSLDNLRDARARGVSAKELKESGCSAAALKAAGFSAKELKEAGFSAAQLKAAGFSAKELSAAGFSPSELRAAGFTAKELRDAGFSDEDLKRAGFDAGELKAAGFSAEELRKAGFSPKELREAGFSAEELKNAGFSAEELELAGYTKGDLIRAGMSVAESSSDQLAKGNPCAKENLKKMRTSKISAAEIKKLGCSAAAMKAAGFTADELKKAGFSEVELRAAGFSDKELKKAGFDGLKSLKVDGPKSDTESHQEVAEVNDLAELLQYRESEYTNLQDNLGRMSDEAMKRLTDQERLNLTKQMQGMMLSQANQLFSSWSPIPTQQYVVGDLAKEQIAGQVAASSQSGSDSKLVAADIYKAGTIIFAVLDTEVNSDESTPVMATIVQGALKGSKVLGNFTRVDKKLLLKFSVLSVPRLTNSISINAVAIDPNTSQTSLATAVDNHYILRYGTLLASSFIKGMGEAIQDSADSTYVSGDTIVVGRDKESELNTTEKALIALGTVGEELGKALGPTFNTPPTVKVKAGVSVGLLLMADLSVSKG